jgi:hypothetical protein
MNLKYSILSVITFLFLSIQPLSAQTNGSNSPYSRFGLGLPNEQSQGFNRSMGGVAQGLRNGKRVNMLNPASLSAIDSLTFLFDVGMGLQYSRLSMGGNRQNVNNTSFDYVNTAFRLLPGLGMGIGFVPYTSIGYTFSQDHPVLKDAMLNQTVTQTLFYEGDGGLHQFYVGAGWNPFGNLSVGLNLSYLWGSINNTVSQTFYVNGSSNSSNYSSLNTKYSADLKTWKADIGLQYILTLDKENDLTLGATVSIGHKIGSEASMLRTSQSGDTIQRSTKNAFQLPMTYSIGAAWKHNRKLTLAADFTLEKWGDCVTPKIGNTGNIASTTTYIASTGTYSDRFKVNLGAEYVPAEYDRGYFHRVNYRFGAYYASPHLKINGMDGPREYGLTAGFGLPITNRWNGGSLVNIGFQWTRRDPSSSSLVTENIFRINIGLTFNEPWFIKWKFK